MEICPATIGDARAIACVHIESWQHAYREILPEDFLAELSVDTGSVMWCESIAKGSPELLVAKADGKVVGFISFGPTRDEDAPHGTAEVWAIYLAPDSWSSGVGRSLWLAARQRMVSDGSLAVSLWVIANNERATKFYRAAGFQPEAGSLKEFELGGVKLQEIRYVQALEGAAR